ncbi:MAG TPA: hypothetical protein VIE44_03485 [Methylomirabilota bacterium]|jgi:hypothetical protein
MQAVVGVVRQHPDAYRILEGLRESGIPYGHVSLLSPKTPESALRAVPTTEAESPGIGGTIGSVVGGATGTASGLAVASLALPGVGPVIAAGALALGVAGAVAGGVVGAQLDETLSKGLPADELYVYRHALRTGRTIVLVMAEEESHARRIRELMRRLGAESVDAAREEWWIGLRDAEKAEYTRGGGDFETDEPLYRMGFDAALGGPGEAPPFDHVRTMLRDRHGIDAETPAFRAGYERGRTYRSRSDGSEPGKAA